MRHVGFLPLPVTPHAVDGLQRREILGHTRPSLTPLVCTAGCSVRPGHVLCATTLLLTQARRAPQRLTDRLQQTVEVKIPEASVLVPLILKTFVVSIPYLLKESFR